MVWEIATLSPDKKAAYVTDLEKVLGAARRNLEIIERDKVEIANYKRQTYELMHQVQEMIEQKKRDSSSLSGVKIEPHVLPLDP